MLLGERIANGEFRAHPGCGSGPYKPSISLFLVLSNSPLSYTSPSTPTDLKDERILRGK